MVVIIRTHFMSLFLFCCLFIFLNVASAGEIKNLDVNSLVGTVISPSKSIKNFSLKSSDGTSFTEKNLKNHWTLLFFGFTRCGYVCPTSMATLKQVYTNLQKEINIPKPQVVFVSIDPERDNLSRINQYVKSFNRNFIGATGSVSDLHELTSQLGILYMKITPTKQKEKSLNNNYDIDHTGSILLVDPEGGLIAVFSMPHEAGRIEKEYAVITSHYSPHQMKK